MGLYARVPYHSNREPGGPLALLIRYGILILGAQLPFDGSPSALCSPVLATVNCIHALGFVYRGTDKYHDGLSARTVYGYRRAPGA